MPRLVSKDNPWLSEESLELLDDSRDDSSEKLSVFFLKAKDENLLSTSRDKLQRNAISQSSEISLASARLEWTSPKIVDSFLKTYVRSIALQKRFILVALETVEVGDLQQEQEKAYIDKQAQLFEACKGELLERYEGSYVLFEDGAVLDSGKSRVELAIRAYKNYGMRPLFIEKVVSEPESLAAVWTPFPLDK